MSECQMCELFSLIDGWLSEANESNLDPTTRETLKECAEELGAKLPPRGHAFHR